MTALSDLYAAISANHELGSTVTRRHAARASLMCKRSAYISSLKWDLAMGRSLSVAFHAPSRHGSPSFTFFSIC